MQRLAHFTCQGNLRTLHLWMQLIYFSMHPRRRNDYRMSYRNPVAIDPAGAHTMETPATHEAGACSIHHQEIGSQGLVASSSQ